MSHSIGDKTFKNNPSAKFYLSPAQLLEELCKKPQQSPGQDVNLIDERKDKVRKVGKIKLEPIRILKLFIGQECYESVNAQKDELLIHTEPAPQTTKPAGPLLDGARKKTSKQINLFPLAAAV